MAVFLQVAHHSISSIEVDLVLASHSHICPSYNLVSQIGCQECGKAWYQQSSRWLTSRRHASKKGWSTPEFRPPGKGAQPMEY